MPATTYAPTVVARAPSPATAEAMVCLFFSQNPQVSDGYPSQTETARSTMLRAVGGRGRPPYTATHYAMSTGATPLAKYRYRRRLPHLQKADADLFVTFRTAGPFILSSAGRDFVLEHCLREHAANVARTPTPANCPKPRINLMAAVVMPDHVHLLLSPLRDGEGWPFLLIEILQCLKSATAHRINKVLHHLGPVWEEESFDHVLRSDESLEEKCEYIRQNPVKAGLVRRAEDYPWLWVNPEFGNRPCR